MGARVSNGPTDLDAGGVLHVELVNTSPTVAELTINATNGLTMLQVPAEPGTANEGYTAVNTGAYEVLCDLSTSAGGASLDGAMVTVAQPRQPLVPAVASR